jgi:DNA-binding GntR family transcriptional regulator
MLHADVVARVRNMLIDGEIPPGSRIPEQSLCRILSISRTPLREALKVLAAEHLVVLLPNRGARAARITLQDIRDLFEFCGSLEATAGELACARITDAEIEEIAAKHRRMQAAFQEERLPEYYRLNREIHTAIVAASRNATLISTYESITARIRRARFVAPMEPEHWSLAVLEHEAILNCLRRRDGTAIATILRGHLRHKQLQAESAGFAGHDEIPAPTRRGRRRAT